MAKHLHVHIHRAPTRDRAPVARAVRSIGRDQHAPEDVSQLVGVLMQIIAEQGGKTQDADFKEEDHKRDAGGKFTAGGMNADQHKAAAKEHRDILNAGTNSEKSGRHHANAAMHHESAAFALEDGATSQAEAHANHAAHHKAEAAKIDEAHAITVHESRSGSASASSKPTSTTAKGARAATHELLSSGHPFSVDELCKATGAPKSTITTVLSAFKNPKYAGKLGTLEIVKRPDGMYHVQKKEGAGLAPKPGPDGQPMGKHPELAAAERRVAENPRTTSSPGLRNPGASFGGAMEAARLSGGTGSMESKSTSGNSEVRHASGTGQSFLPSVKTSGAGAPPAAPQGSASSVPGWDAKKAAALKKNMETLRGRYEVAREKRKARGEHTQSLVEMKARSAYERADREHTSYSFPSKATSGK